MKIILLTIFLNIGFVHVRSECKQNKIIYNYIVDKQFQALETFLKTFNKTYINMSKMKFDVSKDIQADGVKLYDITTTIPGDTYLWTAPEDTEYAEVNFGLDPMTLVINSLQFNGETYKDAKVTVNHAFMKVVQTTIFKRKTCEERYSDFEFFPVKKAVINEEKDITDDVNKIVVPWINTQINSKEFSNVVEEYFNTICDEAAAIKLQKLIESPYSD